MDRFLDKLLTCIVLKDHSPKRSVKYQNVKFEFSPDFTDVLSYAVMHIGLRVVGDIKCMQNLIWDLQKKYEFIFRLHDRDKIHLWNDLDYIMENLAETYGYINIPIAKQIRDITYLALGRI